MTIYVLVLYSLKTRGTVTDDIGKYMQGLFSLYVTVCHTFVAFELDSINLCTTLLTIQVHI